MMMKTIYRQYSPPTPVFARYVGWCIAGVRVVWGWGVSGGVCVDVFIRSERMTNVQSILLGLVDLDFVVGAWGGRGCQGKFSRGHDDAIFSTGKHVD
jgi:hypothetical protein